jgi:hypothetical protein
MRISLACLAAFVLFAAAAGAAGAPRLDGAFDVKVTVVAGTNLLDRKIGDVLPRSWSFKPACARGACNVTLYRQSPAGNVIRVPMRFDGTAYTATETFVGPYTCKGRLVQGGERGPIRWRVVVKKARNVAGQMRAVAISGTAHERFSPAAAVRATGCSTPVSEDDRLVGTRR